MSNVVKAYTSSEFAVYPMLKQWTDKELQTEIRNAKADLLYYANAESNQWVLEREHRKKCEEWYSILTSYVSRYKPALKGLI